MSAAAVVSTSAARELLVDLVSIPSPSGEEDAAAERLVDFLATHGRDAWRDDVGNVRAPADDAVLLTSHVDTVPGDLPVEVASGADAGSGDDGSTEAGAAGPDGRGAPGADGDVLWGRGSVDATGPLAAMAVAAVRTGVSFAGVVREETDSAGARHLVAERGPPDAVLNGEPTGADGIAVGYRGLVAGTYEAETEARHGARPEPNAVAAAMRWWADATAALGAGGDGADGVGSDGDGSNGVAPDGNAPVFERVTAEPLAVEGGPAPDGRSVTATLDVEFRVPPDRTPAELRRVAEAQVDGGALTWEDSIPPMTASARTPVARALRVAIREAGATPRLVRKTGTCDMNVYASAWDRPMATYGPGDSALDHAPDERLPLAEFDRAVAVLTSAAADLADGAGTAATDRPAPGGEEG